LKLAKKPGPKPTGKTETILARVSPEIRAALTSAAEAAGHSLSREIEDRLRRSFATDGVQGEGGAEDKTESLLWGLRSAIERVEDLTGQQWHADGFTRDAAADAAGWFIRFLGPDSGPPPPTFPRGFEWASGDLRLENARQFIEYGVGKQCAETTIRAMVPFPKDHPLARFTAEEWWPERLAARGLKGLVRVRINEKNESQQS
jgi:hypothetical protein